MSGTSLLVVRGLAKAFGGVAAVEDVGFELAAGEMLAMIGPNGAGKTTTFDLLGGQLVPDAGSIRLAGAELAGLPPRAIWQRGVGRTFQVAQTFRSLTVAENVQAALLARDGAVFSFWRRAAGHKHAEALELLAQVGLREQAGRHAAVLAYGDVKRLELAIALAAAPHLLLMDEPTAGMAPAERHARMALTRRLATDRGLAVLFTEHSMDVVFAHADRILVLARGRPIAHGIPQAVRDDPQVRAVYLGTGQVPGAPAAEVRA